MFKFWSIFHIQNLWHSFTRDNSFLQTPSHSLTEKQKNPSPCISRLINNVKALMCVFFLILNCIQANQNEDENTGQKGF